MSRRREAWIVAAILLAAAGLRMHALAEAPPGWRDDEVIETTVHAQRVLDGELPLFFPEASGHEPLYHWLSAGAIRLWGRGLFQVRLASAFFGLLALAAHYRLARRLFGGRVALIATAALALSFWSLMYSRVKIRHVSALVFGLLAFDFALREVLEPRRRKERKGPGLRDRGYGLRITHYVLRFTHHAFRPPLLAALFLGLSLYTYFAARTAPVVLLGFAVYLALAHRPVFARAWRGLAVTLAGAALLAAPLAVAIARQPQAQSRLEVVGAPLAALLQGDPRPALQGALTTLGMFGWAGDPEALYNLPGRPVFEPLGAILFAAGLILCVRRWRDARSAFVLIWLAVGLSPAFVSTPAASLGHAILAQPAAYVALAVGLDALARVIQQSRTPAAWPLSLASCVLCLAYFGRRDLRDYFSVWPSDPEVRRLYRADIRAAALQLRDAPLADAALTGRLSLWDARALELDAPTLQARWFNPETALVYPAQASAPLIVLADPPPAEWVRAKIKAAYALAPTSNDFELWLPNAERGPVFEPIPQHDWPAGLSLHWFNVSAAAHPAGPLEVFIAWRAAEGYAPPAPRIGASPDAPPQPFTTFVHVLGPDGGFVAGYDKFDASAFSLRPGDVVVQRYLPVLPADLAPGTYTLAAGLYDPATGVRYLDNEGGDSFRFGSVQVEP